MPDRDRGCAVLDHDLPDAARRRSRGGLPVRDRSITRAGTSRPDCRSPARASSAERRRRPERTTSISRSSTTGRRPARSRTPSDDRFIININPGLAKLTLGPESTSPGTVGQSVLAADDRHRPRREDLDDQLGHAPARARARCEHRPDLRHADERGPVRLPGAREDERRPAHGHARASRSSSAIPSPSPRSEPFTSGATRARRGERAVRGDAHGDGRQRHYTWSLSSGPLPTGPAVRGRCDQRHAAERPASTRSP